MINRKNNLYYKMKQNIKFADKYKYLKNKYKKNKGHHTGSILNKWYLTYPYMNPTNRKKWQLIADTKQKADSLNTQIVIIIN